MKMLKYYPEMAEFMTDNEDDSENDNDSENNNTKLKVRNMLTVNLQMMMKQVIGVIPISFT